jgi:hypothetical protein
MDPKATFAELRKLQRQEPFQPFRIISNEHGPVEAIEVKHPRLLLVTTYDVIVGSPHPYEPPPVMFDYKLLAIEAIIGIDVGEAK